jgi:hypothetical protein
MVSHACHTHRHRRVAHDPLPCVVDVVPSRQVLHDNERCGCGSRSTGTLRLEIRRTMHCDPMDGIGTHHDCVRAPNGAPLELLYLRIMNTARSIYGLEHRPGSSASAHMQ